MDGGGVFDGLLCAFTGGSQGDAVSNSITNLISPAIGLPLIGSGQQILLTFWHWFLWQPNDGNGDVGHGDVDVSVRNLASDYWGGWHNVTNPASGAGGTYAGNSGLWSQASVDLSAYSGRQIQVGFYQMGGTNPAPGWYIDDVKVVLPAPTITSFTPTRGGVGSGVTVTGDFFAGATAVAFNGARASYTVVSDTEITTTVPVGAKTGPITVTTPSGTATANPQTVTVALNTRITITLTGSDPDVPALPLTFTIATTPAHGVLGALNATTGVVTYTPNSKYKGTDSFTFTVSNGTNNSAPALVTLGVGGGG
jgi:hypothetical protein